MENIESPSEKKANNESKVNNSSKMHYTNNATVRIQRNQAEKQRRDRLNEQIAQLASLVPTAVTATKPLDKVSILRLAASWMRLNYSCLNPKHFKSAVENYLEMHSTFVSNLDVIEKSINGFVVATTFDGVILMCSRYVEDHIGYQNIDLLGYHISNYILSKERELFNKKVRNLISKFKKGSSKKLRNIVRLHMQQRPLPRTNDIRYRKMSFSLTIHSGASTAIESRSKKKSCKLGQRKDFGENAVILIFIEPIRLEPDIDVMYLEQKNCYYTVHGPQGEIIFADHRISIMTGYMPRDVLGTSAYQYIHSSDVPIALFAQRAMFASSDGIGIITYRLRIHDSSYIYLQSKGQIRYKDSSKEIRQFICCNILLNAEDGDRELQKFQDRFAPQLAASKKMKPKSVLSGKEEPSLSTTKAAVCNSISPELNHNKSSVSTSNELFSQNSVIESEIKSCSRSSSEGSNCNLGEHSLEIRETGYGVIGPLDSNQFSRKNFMQTELLSMNDSTQAISTNGLGILNNRGKNSNTETDVLSTISPVNLHSSFNFCGKPNDLNCLLPLSSSNSYFSAECDALQLVENNSFSPKNNFGCLNPTCEIVGSESNFGSPDLFQSCENLNQKNLFNESVDHFHVHESRQPNASSAHFIGELAQNLSLPNKFGADLNQFCIPQSTFQKSETYHSNSFTIPIKNYPVKEKNHMNGITESIYTSHAINGNNINDSSFHVLTETLPQKLNSINSSVNSSISNFRNELLENNDLKSNLDLSFLDQTVEEIPLLNNLSGFGKNSLPYQCEAYRDDMTVHEITLQNSFPCSSSLNNTSHCNTNGINGAISYQSDVHKPNSHTFTITEDFGSCGAEIHSNAPELSFSQKYGASVKRKKPNNIIFNEYDMNGLQNGELEKLLLTKRTDYEKIQNFDQISEDKTFYSDPNQVNIRGQYDDTMNTEFDINLQNSPLYNCAQNDFPAEINPISDFYKVSSNNSNMDFPVHLMKFDKHMDFINIPLSKKG